MGPLAPIRGGVDARPGPDLTVRSRLQVHKQEWSWRPQTFWARKRRLGWLLNCLAWTRLRKSSSGCSRPYRPVLW